MGSLSTTRADQSLAIGLGYLDGNNNVVDGANVEAGATAGIAIGRNANVAAGAAAGLAIGSNVTATGDANDPNNMGDRTGGVSRKSGSVRGDLGGGRLCKKKSRMERQLIKQTARWTDRR